MQINYRLSACPLLRPTYERMSDITDGSEAVIASTFSKRLQTLITIELKGKSKIESIKVWFCLGSRSRTPETVVPGKRAPYLQHPESLLRGHISGSGAPTPEVGYLDPRRQCQ